MEETRPYDLRAMSVGEIFDRALRIYLRHFWFLLAVSLVFLVPVDILYLALAASFGGNAVQEQMLSTVVTLTVGLGTQSLLAGALLQAISDIYLGIPPSLGRSFRTAASRWFPLLVGTFLYSMIIGFGFVFCIVPGLILMGGFFATVPVVVLEKSGPIDALSRSWSLSESMRRRAFAATFFGQSTVSFVATPMVFLCQWLQLAPLHTQALSQTVAGIAAPYASIVLILTYYDFRIRREAFDLQVLAAELHRGATPPPAAAGTA